MLIDGSVRRSPRHMPAVDLTAAAAATAEAARAARRRANAARAYAAAQRRGVIAAVAPSAAARRGAASRRPQSAPFRHSRGLQSVQRQLEHEYKVARLSKSRADEDLMAVLHSRMDSQAASFAKLMYSVERDRTCAAASATRPNEATSRLDGTLSWSHEREPDPEPELELIDHVEVDAVRIACLSSMDNAITEARWANDRVRLLAQEKAAREIGPRVAAAQEAARAAQRRKLEAARHLAQVAEEQAVLRAKAAAATLAMAQGTAAEIVAAAIDLATEEEAAEETERWEEQEALRLAVESTQQAEEEAAARIAAEEAAARVKAQKRAEARERLAAAVQYAKEEAALAADTSCLRGPVLVRAVANRSTGRIRHDVAPRESVFQEDPGRLGRFDKVANAELARVALLWQQANEDMPPHRVPNLFNRGTRGN
eukprot:COSAG02_NODE_1790_length_10923_cov_6.773004_4_plen_428_part_00